MELYIKLFRNLHLVPIRSLAARIEIAPFRGGYANPIDERKPPTQSAIGVLERDVAAPSRQLFDCLTSGRSHEMSAKVLGAEMHVRARAPTHVKRQIFWASARLTDIMTQTRDEVASFIEFSEHAISVRQCQASPVYTIGDVFVCVVRADESQNTVIPKLDANGMQHCGKLEFLDRLRAAKET